MVDSQSSKLLTRDRVQTYKYVPASLASARSRQRHPGDCHACAEHHQSGVFSVRDVLPLAAGRSLRRRVLPPESMLRRGEGHQRKGLLRSGRHMLPRAKFVLSKRFLPRWQVLSKRAEEGKRGMLPYWSECKRERLPDTVPWRFQGRDIDGVPDVRAVGDTVS